MDKKISLFIIVSTGQNLANLPPLLELAQKNDEVLWLESTASRNGKWSQGARRVIDDHGLISRPEPIYIENLNDPTEIISCLQPIIRAISHDKRILFIANGGPKLTPLGVLQACNGLEVEILYGETNPVGYYLLPSQFDKHSGILSYRKHKLDLTDILNSYNYRYFPTAPQPLQVWPGVSLQLAPSEIYGFDEAATIEMHDRMYDTIFAYSEHTDKKSPRFSDLEKALQLGYVKEPFSGWKQAMVNYLFSMRFFIENNTSSYRILNDKKFLTQLNLLYNATVSLSDKVKSSIIRENANIEANHAPNNIGQQFENGVAFRVVSWIEKNPRIHKIIQSVWQNVSVCRNDDESNKVAEWDVLIVLKNGILLNIECKSFTTTPLKELDARLLNLKEMGSEARMIVCFPFYTHYTDKPWFKTLHVFKNKLKKMPYLPFTFPDQAETYSLQQGETSITGNCPSFEAQLERILQPYCLE